MNVHCAEISLLKRLNSKMSQCHNLPMSKWPQHQNTPMPKRPWARMSVGPNSTFVEMSMVPKFLCLNVSCQNAKFWNKLDPNGLPALEVSRMLSFCLFCCNTTSYGMAYWNLIFIYFCSIEKEAFSVLFIIISKYYKWSLHDEGNRSASLFQLCIINNFVWSPRMYYVCGVAHTYLSIR